MKLTKNLFAIALLAASLGFTQTAEAGSESAKKSSKAPTSKAAKKASPKVNTKAAKKASPKANKKAKNFDFTGDEIDAERIRPDGTAIFGLQGVGHKSLIRLRSEFIAEIARSAEML